jgi:hypothetical protein
MIRLQHPLARPCAPSGNSSVRVRTFADTLSIVAWWRNRGQRLDSAHREQQVRNEPSRLIPLGQRTLMVGVHNVHFLPDSNTGRHGDVLFPMRSTRGARNEGPPHRRVRSFRRSCTRSAGPSA